MPLVETIIKQILISKDPVDVFRATRQFTYLAEKGTRFVWLEDLSKIQITWGGDQLYEVEAKKKPQKNFVDVILGTTPDQVKVPTGEKQELKVGFLGEDLWEWMAYLMNWGKEGLMEALKESIVIYPGENNNEEIILKEEEKSSLAETPRRKKREL